MNSIILRLNLFLPIIFLGFVANAQNPVVTLPEVFSVDDTVTIYYNANYGNKALKNFRDDVFL